MTELAERQALLAVISEPLKEQLRDAIREQLSDALYCTRVWSAWSYGTMREDDFVCLAEDDDYVESMVNAVLTALIGKSNETSVV